MTTSKIVPALMGVLVLFALVAVLKIAQSIIIPLVLAVLISFVVSPLIRFLEKVKIPRIIAILIVLVLFFGMFYLFGLIIYASAKSFINALPRYNERFTYIIDVVTTELRERFPVQLDSLERFDWIQAIQGYLLGFSNTLMGFVSNLVIITFFMIFLLMEKRYFKYKIAYAFRSHVSDQISSVLSHINDQVARYLSIKFFISLATGICVYLSLILIGQDFPIIWGTLAFLFNFIPNIGSTFIIFFTILMSFIQFYPDWKPIFAVIITMNLIQLVIGNFIDPKLQGRKLDLSPFLILVSLIFWGWVWGITGMLLSIPLTVIIRIVCDNISFLKPVSIMMSSGKTAADRIKATEIQKLEEIDEN